MLQQTKKHLYLALGWFFFFIGFVGIFVPLLPTTPFMLLTAYFFSKGSERLHHWILSRPHVGPAIQDWNQNRVIRLKAKILSITMITLFIGYPVLFVKVHWGVKLFLILLALSLISFIGSRPSNPLESKVPKKQMKATS